MTDHRRSSRPRPPSPGTAEIPEQQQTLSRRAVDGPSFYSVAEVAQILGTSSVTLYRAIRDGDFPAIRVRGRVIVPARALEAMADVAVTEHTVVDSSGWAVRR